MRWFSAGLCVNRRSLSFLVGALGWPLNQRRPKPSPSRAIASAIPQESSTGLYRLGFCTAASAPMRSLQVVPHLRRGVVAPLAVFLQRLVDNCFQVEWKLEIKVANRDLRLVQDRVVHDRCSFSSEGELASGHLI